MKNKILKTDADIVCAASVVGKKEFDGPLGACFDLHDDKNKFGQKTWEKAESEMQRLSLNTAISKAELSCDGIDAIFAGDLLNQCVGSAYGLLNFDVPYFGLYGACSTSAEGLLLASALIGGGQARAAAVVTSSHNAAAERQFRTPLEYGGQRPPTGQWTVTGAGAFILREPSQVKGEEMAIVTQAMPGIVVDMGVTDANNMGAAMAPAVVSTLTRYFEAGGTRPHEYDLIVTGDLGWEGSRILCNLMRSEGYDIGAVHNDCGKMIFSHNTQDTHCGGSGCGCAAVVLGAYLLPRLQTGALGKILFLATGAMMSPDSVKQGQSIPGVAHLLCLESPYGKKEE